MGCSNLRLRDWVVCVSVVVSGWSFDCLGPVGDRTMSGMKPGLKWDEMTAEERLLAEQLVLNFGS
jgi:hypothetical protein